MHFLGLDLEPCGGRQGYYHCTTLPAKVDQQEPIIKLNKISEVEKIQH